LQATAPASSPEPHDVGEFACLRLEGELRCARPATGGVIRGWAAMRHPEDGVRVTMRVCSRLNRSDAERKKVTIR
jgi:hypothetical protein